MGKYANMYTKCELAAINDVAWDVVHSHQMMMPHDDDDTTAELHWMR